MSISPGEKIIRVNSTLTLVPLFAGLRNGNCNYRSLSINTAFLADRGRNRYNTKLPPESKCSPRFVVAFYLKDGQQVIESVRRLRENCFSREN